MAITPGTECQLRPRAFSSYFLLHSRCRLRSPSLLLFISAVSPPRHLHVRRHAGRSESDSSYEFNESDNVQGFTDQGIEVFKEYIDHISIFKAFVSYGWTLPAIILSMFFATGPKAFLMALAAAIGWSTFSFAIKKFQNRDKPNPSRTSSTFKPNNADLIKPSDQIIQETQEAQSRDSNSKSSMRLGGWDKLDAAEANSHDSNNGYLGGWEEVVVIVKPKPSRRNARKLVRERRERIKKKEKQGTTLSPDVWPLLLRLVIFISPFLSSWFDVFR